MSTIDFDSARTIRDVRLSRSLFLSGIVILFYDHLLTLGPEVQHIWRTTHTRSSMWFLCIRYFSFCGNIIMAVDTFGDFDAEASIWLIIVAQEFIVGCTLFLRVYALYGLSRRILLGLLAAGAVIVSLGAWSVVPVGLAPVVRAKAPGCYEPQLKAQALRNPCVGMASAWAAELAGEIIVIGLTLHRAYTQGRGTASFTGALWRIIIRDGIIYFGMIGLVNTANILMFAFGDIYTSNSLSWFTSAISVAMISRLMLNLHVAARQGITPTSAPDVELETFRFARRTGPTFAASRV
ncbi:hypothetical protein DFH09DRAFT_1322339 [Mycena vulgaris]|nr:hypothetical protein DFH09DRAFT_1322339 [Mycena vulgaris]